MEDGAKPLDHVDRGFASQNSCGAFVKQLPRGLAKETRDLTFIFPAIILKSGGL